MTDECIQIRCITTTTAITTITSREETSTSSSATTTTNGDKPDAFATGNEERNVVAAVSANSSIKKKYVAEMPTERYAPEYNMNHEHRGLALIFNHEFFDIPNLKERTGTKVDVENLISALKNLHFDVQVHKDLKLKQIYKAVETAASKDHSKNDCLLVAILSHGELGYIYAKDAQYKLDSIWSYFTANNCKTLAGKPKLFFIQACQGDRLDPGITMRKTETDGESSMSYKIPTHADFLIAYSTIPGFYSWRNTSNGSWFMQVLVNELNKNAKKLDILTLLTNVNLHVAVDFESCVPDSPMMDQQKQIPCVTFSLTRILRFNDKNKNNFKK